MVETVPKPGQGLIVQKNHEVGQDRVAVDAARTDLPHQIHPDRVSSKRKKSGVAKAQNSAVTPNQIDRQCQERITEILTNERKPVGGNMERGSSRHDLVEERNDNCDQRQKTKKPASPGILAGTNPQSVSPGHGL